MEEVARGLPSARVAKDDGQPYLIEPDLDVEIYPDEAGNVDSVVYGPAFPGRVEGISMGNTGDEVEDRLGPPDRLWPMPHPNYVLLYDRPRFLRVELDRETEQVILLCR